MPEIKAALFDIDNTLVDAATDTLYPGLEEVLRPDSRPFALSHITARTAGTYAQVLRRHAAIVPNAGMPIGLEYGTKLIVADDYTDVRTYTLLSRSGLTPEEQTSVTELASGACGPVHVTFASRHPAQGRIHWRSGDQCPGVLQDLLSEHEPGLVNCRLTKIEQADRQNISHLQVYSYKYTGGTMLDILSPGTNKKYAAGAIMNLCGLTPPEVLIGGDSAADYGMLGMAGIHAVLVEQDRASGTAAPVGITRVVPDRHAAYLRGSQPS